MRESHEKNYPTIPFNDHIKELERKYKDAPDNHESTALELTQEIIDKGIICFLYSKTTGEHIATIMDSGAMEDGKFSSFNIGFSQVGRTDSRELLMSEEDAIAKAEDFLKIINLDQFYLNGVVQNDNRGNLQWELSYVKKYSSLDETFIDSRNGLFGSLEPEFDAGWRGEYIIIDINDNQILSFQWVSPTQASSQGNRLRKEMNMQRGCSQRKEIIVHNRKKREKTNGSNVSRIIK